MIILTQLFTDSIRFGWPCLQQSFQGDLTEKYAGHFLIANIIDKFSINRTIILQVLTSLMQAHHQVLNNHLQYTVGVFHISGQQRPDQKVVGHSDSRRAQTDAGRLFTVAGPAQESDG
jgi:hypothetical protein